MNSSICDYKFTISTQLGNASAFTNFTAVDFSGNITERQTSCLTGFEMYSFALTCIPKYIFKPNVRQEVRRTMIPSYYD